MSTLSSLLLFTVYLAVSLQSIHATSQTKVVESFHVRSDVRFRFATTQIETVIRNTAYQAQEIVFDVTLPKEAFIVNFSMEIDGKVYNGEVKEKVKAQKEYMEAVNKGESAGLVRQTPRHSNTFDVSVNVATGSAAKFSLIYQEMLRRKMGLYEHEIHVNPGQKVDDFIVEVFIEENRPLNYVKTLALRTDLLMTKRNEGEVENKLIIVDRPSSETAYIKYMPSIAEQSDSSKPARFIVEYDVEHSSVGDVMVVDGYFVHFFAPDLSPMSKDIIFILDTSGSMDGQKISQLKTAMITILDDLQPDDRFDIITFSYWVEKWRNELVTATPRTVNAAKGFIQSIHATGGTDINSALLAGISELKHYEDRQRVGMIFFLTDGLPTSGVQNADVIIANVLETNGNATAIFGLAFGSEADYELLKIISAQNSGFARKIYADSDAALQVASLYEEISAVSIKDVTFKYFPGTVDEITNNKFPVIFNGSEVIVSGKMSNDIEVFQLEIKGIQKTGLFDLDFRVDDVNDLVTDSDGSLIKFFTMPRDFSGIVEKMWAYLTIKQYLKEKEIHVSNKNMVDELDEKILEISMKYKFVTPLTSMVVTKPDNPDTVVESEIKDADGIKQRSAVGAFQPPSYGLRSRPFRYRSSQVHPVAGSNSYSEYQGIPQYQSYPSYDNHLANSHQDNLGPIPFNSFNPVPVMRPMFRPVIVKTFQPMIDETTFRPMIDKTFRLIIDKTTFRPMIDKTTSAYLKKSKHAKTKKHRSFTIPGFQLAAVIAGSKDLGVCLAPKNVNAGTYKLMESPSGAEVNIETACGGKKCRNILVKKLVLESNGQIASLSLDNTTGAWKFQSSAEFNVTKETPDNIIIVGGDLEIRVSWTQVKRSRHYLLNIMVNSAKDYKGLIGNILNMSARQKKKWRRHRVPPVCKSTDFSGYLTNKIASKYME